MENHMKQLEERTLTAEEWEYYKKKLLERAAAHARKWITLKD